MLKKFIIGIFKPKFLFRYIVKSKAKNCKGRLSVTGSVVVKDIPALSVAGGHPAKAFKMRDIEHYNRLKDQKQFF
jgi:hypothetical protein